MAVHDKYIVTGRYMNGTEVSGYHLVTNSGDEHKKVTREQFIFMLGKGLIANCTGQVYGNQVIIRGTNISIGDLPIVDDKTGKVRKPDDKTNVRPKKGEMLQILDQLTLTGRLMFGRDNVGFEVKNHGGQVRRLPREEVIKLADEKLISNATVQNLNENGKVRKILRGAGIDLRDLATIQVDKNGAVLAL